MRIGRSLQCMAVLFSLVAPSVAAPLPQNARLIPAPEVRDMYSGKTWSWKDASTGIYFQPSGSLVAYEDGPDERVGQGRWTVDSKGSLYVDVRWDKATGGNSRYRSCWSHRRVGNAVWKQHFQRNRWYSLFGRSNEAGRIAFGNRLKAFAHRSVASR